MFNILNYRQVVILNAENSKSVSNRIRPYPNIDDLENMTNKSYEKIKVNAAFFKTFYDSSFTKLPAIW